MADNTTLNPGTGGDVIASDDIGGVKHQRVKLVVGAEGVNDGDVADANPMPVKPGGKQVTTLLNAVTTNQTSAATAIRAGRRTLQVGISGTGAIAATVEWYGNNSNAASGGVLLATMSLSGTDSDVAGADMPAEWPYMYAILSGISGTAAAVTASVGA